MVESFVLNVASPIYLPRFNSSGRLEVPKQSILLGNVANTITIIASVIFLVLLVAQHDGSIDIFSKSFVEDGFCVSNKDKPIYMQSHAMCFYADTTIAILMYLTISMCAGNMSEETY